MEHACGDVFGGNAYNARLLKHNLFQLRASSNDGLDGSAKITVTLANADSHFSEIERETGFKGAQVTITFLFYDLVASAAASESRVVFQGTGESAAGDHRIGIHGHVQEPAESAAHHAAGSADFAAMSRGCFRRDLAQREEALDGGATGKYSALYKCGYSPDLTGGVGNLNSGVAVYDLRLHADVVRGARDVQRGFVVERDGAISAGSEFVPPQIQVRAFGEKGTQSFAGASIIWRCITIRCRWCTGRRGMRRRSCSRATTGI